METTNEPKNLLQDTPVEQRAALLKEMAVKVEFEKVKRHYNEDEKSQIKDAITEESIQLMDKQEEFKAIKKEFDKAIKANKDKLIIALKDVKRGYSENEEDVYLIDDQESGLMNVYDASGTHLYARKLFPEERQARIVSMAKTGTHD